MITTTARRGAALLAVLALAAAGALAAAPHGAGVPTACSRTWGHSI